MLKSNKLKKKSDDLYEFKIQGEKDFKILQLTDLHLGFGFLSRRKDKLALKAIDTLVKRTEPDFIIITGDMIFPFLPKTGTMNNTRQARIFTSFMDRFKIPYTMTFGNHDSEMGSWCKKEELADILSEGRYCIMGRGKKGITGVGNFIINLTDNSGNVLMPLVLIDSNMYGDGWFYSGFDRIHDDQIDWCISSLENIKYANPGVHGLAFFHIPLREFRQAYTMMKLGDKDVVYNHGCIGEKDDHFGVSKYESPFFDRIYSNGVIKGIFCGHDHLSNLSLTYKGIMMTYGMSIDYLGYRHIDKRYVQRGATLITRKKDGSFTVDMVPLSHVVADNIRGE